MNPNKSSSSPSITRSRSEFSTSARLQYHQSASTLQAPGKPTLPDVGYFIDLTRATSIVQHGSTYDSATVAPTQRHTRCPDARFCVLVSVRLVHEVYGRITIGLKSAETARQWTTQLQHAAFKSRSVSGPVVRSSSAYVLFECTQVHHHCYSLTALWYCASVKHPSVASFGMLATVVQQLPAASTRSEKPTYSPLPHRHVVA
jgi:hypothetical protein